MTNSNPTPSDIWAQVLNIKTEVALDTETSGLFTDDGARMSTISLAWIDEDGWWSKAYGVGQRVWDGGVLTIRDEPVFPGQDGTLRVVSVAWPFDQGVAGTGKTEDDGQQTLWPEADNQSLEQYRQLLDLLRYLGVNNGLVMHHAKFDTHIMAAGVRRWRGIGVDLLEHVVWDTQAGNALLYADGRVTVIGPKGAPVVSTSLKPTAKMLWGDAEGDEQNVVKAYLKAKKLPSGRWDLMPWDVIGTYADDDARKTIRLYHRQQHDIGVMKNPWCDLNASMDRRMQVSRMLTRIERRGLPWDAEGARAASAEIRKRARLLEKQLPFKPTINAAKDWWFGPDGLNLEPFAVTDGGQPSVTAEIIERMVGLHVQGAKEWRDLQKVQTADSRWYTGWTDMVGSDGRLRASFRQNGTVSGRFSIERVQLQAIPHDYRLEGYPTLEGIPTPRTLIGAGVPDGFELWELDLANAEARVAALLGKCKPMLEMIHAGLDLHGEVTKTLFKIDPSSHEWGFYRNIGKRADFSFIFGVGWETFNDSVRAQTGIELGEKESRRIVREWNAMFPQYQQAIDLHSRKVEQRQRRYGYGWIDLINGERRWFQKNEETHKAFNQRVQGNLAQFGQDWWLEVEAEASRRYGNEPVVHDGQYVGHLGVVMLIHDSVVLLTPKDDGPDLVQFAVAAGVKRWEQWFPGVIGGVDAKRWTDKG